MLLALDTATSAVTVAVHDGTDVVAEATTVDPLRQGELLAPQIAKVLELAGLTPADVSQLAVGVGPGPFTGLRVGIVTARTMGAVLDVDVVGVCTLDVVAAAVDVAGTFLVATDARRKEVYWARYACPTRRITEASVAKAADIRTDEPVAGHGPLLYPADLPHAVEPSFPNAADLARLVAARAVRLLPPEPLYLRRPDVGEPGARKKARA
ncbi:MAG: tRNA (adenosine(37)-N6)-threonylcarbamoyltransferase complex dimerization subunit type 1 TsaB [Nocardioidaceae bacterium]